MKQDIKLAEDSLNFKFAFGGASISGEGKGYGFGKITETEAIDLLKASFDLGVRIFDTAPIYGFSLSEKRMGKAFAKTREKVFLVSKCGVDWHDNMRVNMSNDPKLCKKMLEQSLRDLASDYIDLYMVHWPDPKVDIRHTLEVLQRAKEEGKILSIGLCNTTEEEIKTGESVAKIDWLQSEYNLLSSQNLDLFQYAKKTNRKTMSWGSLDKGILTGRVDRERKFETEDCRSWAPWWKQQNKEWKYDLIASLQTRLSDYGFSLLDFNLAFLEKSESLDLPILGIRSQKQLSDVQKSAYKNITNDFFQEHMEWVNANIEEQNS